MKRNVEQIPLPRLMIFLGSIAVHAEELLSPKGHEYDRIVLETLLKDPEVVKWIKDHAVYLPVKR